MKQFGGRSFSLLQYGRNESGEATGQCPDPFSTSLNQSNTPSPDIKQFGGRSISLPPLSKGGGSLAVEGLSIQLHVVGRRYSPIQHGRKWLAAQPPDPPVQLALCAAAPSSSKKPPRELILSRALFDEGLRCSPVSGEQLRIALTCRTPKRFIGKQLRP